MDTKLRAAVQSYDLEAGSFVEALARVGSQFHLVMGIEWVHVPAAEGPVKLSWKNATVREVLETIANRQPGYKIVVRKGVVHVFPADAIAARENPLKLNISAFSVQNVPAEFASRELRDIVQQNIAPPKAQQGPGGIGGSGASNIDDPKISVRLKNASVEDALDAIASASARKIWIVTFLEKANLTPAGFRRTITLWNNFPIPDTEQPVWDLLHWGDQLPNAVLGKT